MQPQDAVRTRSTPSGVRNTDTVALSGLAVHTVVRRTTVSHMTNVERTWRVESRETPCVGCASSSDGAAVLDQYNIVTKEHPLGEREKVWVNWNMLDKSTLNKAEMRPELRPKTRTFAAITAFVEELHVESLSNKLFNRVVGKGDAMDVGAVNVREPVGEEDEKYSAAEWAAW